MIKREECIKRIEFHLSQLRAEVELNNSTCRFDINQAAEDVICSLLNLIYGWDLGNENHQQQNTAAVDLTDRKGRLAVQVTSDGSRKKIQSTIDTFIDHELYRDFDQLYILLLTNRKSQKMPFETGSLFSFDSRQHIMDFRDLTKKLRTLDTETLEKITLYLDDALKDAPAGPVHKRRFLFITVALAALAALAAVAAVGISSFFRGPPIARVYLSQILPYTAAGYIESYDNVSPVYRAEIETENAFSILSFVRSDSSSDSRIEKLSCRILSLEPIEDPVLILDAVFVGDTLRLFAFNDGWGTAETVHLDAASLGWGDSVEPLSQIISDTRSFEDTDIDPASAVLLAEFDLDRTKFQAFRERHDWLSQSVEISIRASGGNCSSVWSAYLYLLDDGFGLDYGGNGDHIYDITLFAVLDVDSKPSELTFTGPDSTPRVGDTLRVETVLAPTKSCVVTCRNEFLVNGASQQTDVYTATVKVPAFGKRTIGTSSPLTEELAQLDVSDELSFKRTLQKYYYDPENIFKQYE